MNILLLTEGFYPKTGGGAYTNWEFAKCASEKGHDVTVFTTKLKNTDSIETKRGVKIFRPHPGAQQTKHSSLEFFKRIQFLLKVYSSCSTWLEKNSADVIFSTTHLTHPVAKLIGIIHDIPVINFIAYSPSLEETERSLTNPRFLFEQLNIFGCMGDIVFTRTKNIKHIVHNNSFSSPSVQTIDGVLRKDKILSSVKSANQEQVDYKNSRSENIRLSHVGRLTRVKDTESAIEIIGDLPSQYELQIIGDGPRRNMIEDYIDELGLKNRITMLGELPHEETLQRVHHSNGVLLTSRAEAYPTVAFEGLALGVNVFATPVGKLCDIQHPNLQVTEKENMPSIIKKTDLTGKPEIDESVLNRYSLKTFCNTILKSCRQVQT